MRLVMIPTSNFLDLLVHFPLWNGLGFRHVFTCFHVFSYLYDITPPPSYVSLTSFYYVGPPFVVLLFLGCNVRMYFCLG